MPDPQGADLSKGRCFGYALSTIRDDRRFQERAERLVADEYEARFQNTHRWGGVFLDLKYTESAVLFSRPAGKDLLQSSARGDVIVFPYLDRGFKHMRDLLSAMQKFRLRGVRLWIPEIGLDTAAHQDLAAMLERMIEFDNAGRRRNFQETIKDNWQEGKATPGRRPAIGFRHEKVGDNTFVIGDQAHRALMGRMLDWAEKGWAPQQIATKLNLDGITNPEGSPWNKVTVGHWVAAERVIRSYEEHSRSSMVGKVCPVDLREALRQDVLKEIRQGNRQIPTWV